MIVEYCLDIIERMAIKRYSPPPPTESDFKVTLISFDISRDEKTWELYALVESPYFSWVYRMWWDIEKECEILREYGGVDRINTDRNDDVENPNEYLDKLYRRR